MQSRNPSKNRSTQSLHTPAAPAELSVWEQKAMKEWELIQGIIARHEDQAFKTRGAIVILVAALSAALFAQKPVTLLWNQYLAICWGAVLIFFLMELWNRAVVRLCVDRVDVIERFLRGEAALGSWGGPGIKRALTRNLPLKAMRSELYEKPVYVPLMLYLAAVLMIAMAARG
jgi:hypothetical protein